MSTKAERRAAEQQRINDMFADTNPIHRPSPWQHRVWLRCVGWDDGCDDDGWWEGTCPMSPRGNTHPARFNFHKDVMQCNEPDAGGGLSCHDGKAMLSLSNAMLLTRNG